MKTKFSKQQIVSAMKNGGVVPLFTTDNAQDAIAVVEMSYHAGLRTFEFTNRRPNSFEVFVQVLKHCEQFPDLMLGIGTIMDGPTTKKFIDAGAHFIISPIVNPDMAKVCHDYDIPWIPGCFSLTEIVLAKQNGAGIIKLFPASVLGPGFVSSIMPVVPGLQLMITGGVEPNEESLRSWFKAGAACVGIGSQLFSKDVMENKNWTELKARIEMCLAIVQKVRQK